MLSRPLRLIFVATLPEPGGAASHLISLARALATAGHVVGVVTTPASVIWTGLQGVSGISLFAGRFSDTPRTDAVRDVRESDGPIAVSRALQEIDAQHVFAIFEDDYWGTIRTCRARGVPVSLFLHHAGMRRTNRLLLPLTRRQWVVPSRDLQQWLVSRRVATRRTAVLHNPVDTAHFKPDAELRAATRAALGFAPDDLVVGFVGRLEANKGVEPFAESVNQAMALVPNLRALWIGFGRKEADVDRIINTSPFTHRHARRPWTDEVLPYYCAMDLLALPSIGRESFGRVLVEAQSCAVPVLGSAVGGIPETMRPGQSGELVPPGDIRAWVHAIASLCTAPDRRAEMGTMGRAFVRAHFDSTVIVQDFERLVGTSA